jgi:RNA recognition motif-containing protein
LYVGNLNFKTRERDLREEFSRYGKIVDVYIPSERSATRQSSSARGFGFVTFEDERDAEEAAEDMDEREFDGRIIRVNKARPREPLPDGARRRSPSSSQVCRDYQRGKCSRGDICRFIHEGEDRKNGRDRGDSR